MAASGEARCREEGRPRCSRRLARECRATRRPRCRRSRRGTTPGLDRAARCPLRADLQLYWAGARVPICRHRLALRHAGRTEWRKSGSWPSPGRFRSRRSAHPCVGAPRSTRPPGKRQPASHRPTFACDAQPSPASSLDDVILDGRNFCAVRVGVDAHPKVGHWRILPGRCSSAFSHCPRHWHRAVRWRRME